MVADADREKELDEYEARFGRYVKERGSFGKVTLTIGAQSFSLDWDDDPELTKEMNDSHRRWFKRMLCNALHNLVVAETPIAAKEPGE